jgi:hypothetical protein
MREDLPLHDFCRSYYLSSLAWKLSYQRGCVWVFNGEEGLPANVTGSAKHGMCCTSNALLLFVTVS